MLRLFGVNGIAEMGKESRRVFKAGSARKEWRVRASSNGNENYERGK